MVLYGAVGHAVTSSVPTACCTYRPVPALVIDGAGQGLAVAPLAVTVLSRVTPQHAGAVAGVLATGIRVGNALGVAMVGVIFYCVLNHAHGANVYVHSFSFSPIYVLFAAALLAAFVQLLPRTPGGRRDG